MIHQGEWNTRCGVVVAITHKTAPAGKWAGKIEGLDYLWADDGSILPSRRTHALDLISPLEDSQTQIKSESKMDVKVGDKVLIEAIVYQPIAHDCDTDQTRVTFPGLYSVVVPRSAIKSVEPKPATIGDTVTWLGYEPGVILASVDGWWWLLSESGERISAFAETVIKHSSFRIIKRAGGE